MTRWWVLPTRSLVLVVPLLDRRGNLPLMVVKQDMWTLTIGAICSLAMVGSSFFFTVGFLFDIEYSMVDLELNDDDLDLLCEIEGLSRGEQHSQFGVDFLLLTVYSHLDSWSICWTGWDVEENCLCVNLLLVSCSSYCEPSQCFHFLAYGKCVSYIIVLACALTQ